MNKVDSRQIQKKWGNITYIIHYCGGIDIFCCLFIHKKQTTANPKSPQKQCKLTQLKRGVA